MKKLQQLIGVAELPVTFLETAADFDPSDYVTDFPGREIDVEPVVNLIEEAVRRYPEKPDESEFATRTIARTIEGVPGSTDLNSPTPKGDCLGH
jgi:hypothetical protein